jgi:serine/threonine protein kinase
MSTADESEVLNWFERSLDQPALGRKTWLESQQLPAWLHARVLRLIDTESRLGQDFLEAPAAFGDVPAFPQEGERVGDYALVRQIDAGGMGVVYLARRADEAYDQHVAIKLIRPLHLNSAPQYRERLIARFENERALLARLNHRNVARILDGGSTASGIPYIVMEYVEGLPLNLYCDTHNIDIRGRVQLFRKVCDGVQEAHRHLIVHRDLKPDNILVTAEGEPRLLDFGIARTLESEAARLDETHTLTSLTAMTPAYASPEQIRHQPLTTSSDVYSLGVVLYQLLAGARPYDTSHLPPIEADRVVAESTPPPLHIALASADIGNDERRRRIAQLAPDLERIVAKAMHKDPLRRYTTAQDFGDDLGRFLDGEPVRAHPDSAWYRSSKFLARHRAASIVSLFAFIGILVASGVAVWQADAARRAAADTQLMNEFLLDVTSMSDPFDAGSELTLSQALDAAAEKIDERFTDRPDLSAQLRFGIGYSMLSRYRLDQASIQLERAWTDSKAQFGETDIRTLRVLEGVAGLRQEQGRVQEAQRLFEQGIAAIEATNQRSDPLYLQLVGNLGNLHLTLEQYHQADARLRQAQHIHEAQGGKRDLEYANLLSNLAHAAHGLEDYELADARYQEAQQAYEALFPDGNPDLAILLNNRALLAEDRGFAEAALELHQRSLAVRRRVFGGEHPMIVVALANVARMSATLGNPTLARSAAKEATAMADRVYTAPNARHASVYASLAEAELANNEPVEAIRAWTRARDLLATVPDAPPSVGQYLERVLKAICARQAGADVCRR